MAVKNILSMPDKRLRTKAQPISKVDARIQDMMGDLFDTMKWEDQGIGLAANQIGILERVIVIDIGPEHNKEPLYMANPEILFFSDDIQTFSEGCLSVPDQYSDVSRPQTIQVRYIDQHNKTQELSASGLLSTCIQHEVDHLNGILFVEHLPPIRRKLVVSRALKAAKKLTPPPQG